MPVEFKDYYATLGLTREASEEEIKKAFRKLARQHHPDVAKDKKGSEEKFKDINEAYEVLSDPEKRQKYDRLGACWQDEGGSQPPPGWQGAGSSAPGGSEAYEFHFGGTGFSDFFEQFFGGGRSHGFAPAGQDFDMDEEAPSAPHARRGHDIEGDILVTLEEAMHGTQRPLSLQTVNPRTRQTETHAFQVRIPPGATDGRRIRVPSKGEPGQHGGAAGDLYLRVRHAAHPDFRTREADVYHDLDLAPWEAVLGAHIIVPTLDGTIKLHVPAGAANGQQLRVRQRGLPKGKTGERGDFYAIISVQVPPQLTEEERALWQQLQSVSRFDPRSAPSP